MHQEDESWTLTTTASQQLGTFLATSPTTDFTKLLADVVEVADDFQATDLDERVTKITTDGGIYIAPNDVRRFCPSCRTLAISLVDTERARLATIRPRRAP
jgi:hypothetical protein